MTKDKKITKTYPTMLTIAGSDPIGGAGIQADIKTATALGVYSMSVITAVTAQNTVGVRSWLSVGKEMLNSQMEAVFEDVRPKAVKIGMIPDPEMVAVIRDFIEHYQIKNVVLDPVCVASSGDALTDDKVPQTLIRLLAPLAKVLTPNLPEASVILRREIANEHQASIAEEILYKTGAEYVLLKGGHSSSTECTDILVSSDTTKTFLSPRVDTVNTHGTGCTLSSAIASFLALGYSVPTAVERAHQWLYKAISDGATYKLGHGHGPVNHLFNIPPYEYND